MLNAADLPDNIAAFKQAAFGRKSEKTEPDQFDRDCEEFRVRMGGLPSAQLQQT